MNKVLEKGPAESYVKIFSSCTALQFLAFTIPLAPKLIPLLVIFTLLCTIVEWKMNRSNSVYSIPKFYYWFIAFYLLHVIGLLYSENKAAGLFSLEVKLSLLLFPLVFFVGKLETHRKLNKILFAFIQGCLASVFVCIIHAGYKYYLTGDPGVFYYSSLSPYLHSSYLSLYLNFGLFILLFLKAEKIIQTWYSVIIISIILIVFIILLSSKAGIFSLFFSFLILLLQQIVSGNYKRAILVLIIMGLLGSSIYFAFPVVRTRIAMMKSLFVKDGRQADSNVARTHIWKASVKLFKETPVIGVGPGDVNDTLLKEYDNAGLHEVYVRRLNAHNQYLQSLLGLGIIGLLVLLATLGFPLLYSMNAGFWLYSAFLYLVSFNFLFESMLETQAGVVFYAFFNSLLFSALFYRKKTIETSSSDIILS